MRKRRKWKASRVEGGGRTKTKTEMNATRVSFGLGGIETAKVCLEWPW